MGLATVVLLALCGPLADLVSLGVITRFALAGLRPLLSVVLLAVVMLPVLITAILPIMAMGALVALLGGEGESVILTAAGFAVASVVLGLVCCFVWRGLPATVDRFLGPSD